MRNAVLTCLCAALCAVPLFAASPVVTTVVVAKDGSGDFTTIQAAVNSLRSAHLQTSVGGLSEEPA